MVRYEGKTKQEWDDSIEQLSFRDKHLDVLRRLYTVESFEYLNTDGKEGEQYYIAIMPFQLVDGSKVYSTKLDWQDVSDEFDDYKLEITNKIALTFRVLSLHNWRAAADNAGHLTGVNNQAVFLKTIIDSYMTEEVTEIEAEDLLIKVADDFNSGVDEKEDRIKLGVRVIATINYMNELNNITAPQLSAILSDVDIQSIMALLQSGSLSTAKAIINAKDLSALVPMDQSYKDKVTQMIDDYLGL